MPGGYGKAAYLSRLTSRFRFRTIDVGQQLEGVTPPSVFIGRWGYPKVFIGPMITAAAESAAVADTPEAWIPGNMQQSDIIGFRLCLVRGQSAVGVRELDSRLVGQMQDIALAKGPVGAEAEFTKKPQGFQFNNEYQPFGPSAPLKAFSADNARWERQLEKAYYDTDMKAADAVIESYNKGLLFSQIQKAFSVGAFGTAKRRRLVPTRWSITAVDDILGKHLLAQVSEMPVIDRYQVYEYSSLNNRYVVLLLPTQWQYEWIEAFIHVLGMEEVVFADHEFNEGKKAYSSVGGCYYSCKFAVLEGLLARGVQAGVIVFREAYPGYVPLGVFNVRENTRWAMRQQPREFGDLRSALDHISTRLWLPLSRFVGASTLLKKVLMGFACKRVESPAAV